MNDVDAALRAAHEQAAILRTLAIEIQREERLDDETLGLRAQAAVESARLVLATEDLARVRFSSHPSADRKASRDALSIPRRWPRVLVVEDDEATRTAIARGLAPEYEVVLASNGVEGLAAASAVPFDAIVADISMPEMDGITMVARIREMHAPNFVPVVFLSGETTPERVAAGFLAGGTSYMLKPVDLDLLDQEIRSMLSATPDE